MPAKLGNSIFWRCGTETFILYRMLLLPLRRRKLAELLLSGMLFLGCTGISTPLQSSDASTSNTNLCDPLARHPVELGPDLSVAQDPQGTLYVADRTTPTSSRVFVSIADTLYERHVAGSGLRGTTDYTLSYNDVDNLGIAPQVLLVQTSNGSTVAMALAPNGTRYFIGDANATYQLLQVIDSSRVAALKVLGLPNEIIYMRRMSVTQEVVITISASWGSDAAEYGVYIGTKGDMVECKITSVDYSGALSGPLVRTITCAVDSTTQQFQFVAGDFIDYSDAGVADDAGITDGDRIYGYSFHCLNGP